MLLSSRYSLLHKKVSSGGHGSIDVYEDNDLERKVAVKTLHANADPKRLLDEIAALGKIRSNNVVQVYDIAIERKKGATKISLIQEYIEGSELSTFVGSHVSLDDVMHLLFQLASALVDVHDAGITHRDIKPSNVKVDSEGVLKLYDFGLARFVAKQSTVGMVGTPGFMAPELRHFGRVEFTNAVDVFAFGRTAWSLLHEETELAEEPDFDGYDFDQQPLSPELCHGLNKTLSVVRDERPTMREIRMLLYRELTHNQHRAQLVTPTETATLDKKQAEVKLASAGQGSCELVYDGYGFYIVPTSGDVYINNVVVTTRRELADSCLITLGATPRGRNRVFIPFDISHPEVMI